MNWARLTAGLFASILAPALVLGDEPAPVAPGRPSRLRSVEIAAAPAAPSMTLADLESLALSCHPTLVQASARISAAQGRMLQAGLAPNPRVGYVGDEIGNESAAGLQGVIVSQEFVTGRKLALSQATASWEVERARCECAAARQRILTDVRQGYFEALVAQQLVSVYADLAKISDIAVKASESLFKADQVTRVDVLQSRIEAREARLRHAAAQRQHHGAWRWLSSAIAQPDLPLARLDGDLARGLPQLEWEQSLARILANSPELCVANAEICRARASLVREQAEPIPNITAQVQVQHDTSTGDTVPSLQITLPLPIFDRNQGNIQRAAAEISAASAERDRRELDLRQRLARALQRYEQSKQEVAAYGEDIIPDATTSLELVQKGYESEELSYLQVITAQRTLFNARVQYVIALGQLQRSAAEIDGLLLSGNLSPAAADR